MKMFNIIKTHFRYWKNGLREENERIAEYLKRKHRYFPLLHPDMIKWVLGNIAYTFGFIQGVFRPKLK